MRKWPRRQRRPRALYTSCSALFPYRKGVKLPVTPLLVGRPRRVLAAGFTSCERASNGADLRR